VERQRMSSGIGSCDNLELPSPTFNHKTKPQIPLKFDHNQIWTQLRHLIKTQIKGDLDENPTGQALADLIHKEQKILAKEVKWLQDKAWKARRRADERKEHRNKTQNTLLKGSPC